MKIINKKEQGRKNRASGKRFEARVMQDLENKGFITARWTKSVELPKLEEAQAIHLGNNKWLKRLEPSKGRLINPKPRYNPFTKSIQYSQSGFPDFIAFRGWWEDCRDIKTVEEFNKITQIGYNKILTDNVLFGNQYNYNIIGIECKSDGYLTKEEKEKCKWYLDNHLFSKIFIVKKGKKRGEIIYKEFGKEVIK